MLDGVHAAFDGVLDAVGAGGVGERLLAVLPAAATIAATSSTGICGGVVTLPFFEIDDAADQQLDAIRPVGHARGDAIVRPCMILDRLAHERAIAPA